jgi:hypothetical protein
MVETELKHKKRWRVVADMSWYIPSEVDVAGVAGNQIVHYLSCGGWQLSCK